MALRFDDATRTLELSVHDLLGEEPYRRLGADRGESFRRLWLGQALHCRYQDRCRGADATYEAEVSLRHETELEDWKVVVRGRLDGLCVAEDGAVVVEEVKSLHFAGDLSRFLVSERMEVYRRQLRLYCLFLQQTRGVPVRGRLVLLDIATTRERTVEVEWDAGEVALYLEARLRLVLGEHRRAERDRHKRALAADVLPFPHPAPRPHQRAMAEEIAAALAAGRHLLVNAPTGSGKTAAALWVAARFALASGRRVYFLTAKTLQQEIAIATLKRLAPGGARALRLRAKAKMCANDEIVCHEDYCDYAAEYGAKLARGGVLERLTGAFPVLEPEVIYAAAKSSEVCPFEVSLDLVSRVDVIVADYNYVFDPFVALRGPLEGSAAEGAVLIIDEAHNLLARGRGYFSPELATAPLAALEYWLAERPDPAYEQFREPADSLRREIEALAEASLGADTGEPADGLTEIDRGFFTGLRAALEPAVLAYLAHKREHGLFSENDPVMDFFFSVVRFDQTLARLGPEFAQIVSRDSRGVRLKLLCRDPARFIGEIVGESHATIAMSATLSPVEFYRRTLGFEAGRTGSMEMPSPFPPENRKVLVLPQVDTTWKKRREHYDGIARIVAELAEAVDGNSLALFPSYVFLREVAERLPEMSRRTIVQRVDATDIERGEVLERLREKSRGTLVLAVAGGIYSEGVDYPGAMLSGVFVVSPSLPPYGLEQELLRDYYEEKYEQGFAYAYLIPGLTRVVQSAGRLIRSETDTGLIALICRRFTNPEYARYLPADWWVRSPRELVERDYAGSVRRFFAALKERENPCPTSDPRPQSSLLTP